MANAFPRVRGFLDGLRQRTGSQTPVIDFLGRNQTALLGFASGDDWGDAFGGFAQGLGMDRGRRDLEAEKARQERLQHEANELWRGLAAPHLAGAPQIGGGSMPGAPSITAPQGDSGDWMRAGSGAGAHDPNRWRDAIASIESAGSGDYQAVGPVADERGSRAYGRYQVMDYNIGPWTEQVLGRRMSPQEFLANPEAQDAVFDAIFGGYVQQYGEEGAARAWFGGPGRATGGGAATDVNGMSVDRYGERFTGAAGGSPGGDQRPTASAQPPADNRWQIATSLLGNELTAPLGQQMIMQLLTEGPPRPDYETFNPEHGLYDTTARDYVVPPVAGGNEDRRYTEGPDGIPRYLDNQQPVFPGVEAPPEGPDLTAENALRGQFNAIAAPLRDTAQAYNRIQAAYANPSPASDVSIIFAYMRMLDPASTVREGEFATAQQTTGVPGQIVNLYNRLISGERLNEAQRADFYGQAGALYQAAITQYEQYAEFYRNIATDGGMDPARIILPLEAAEAAPQDGGGPVTITNDAEYDALAPGTRFVGPDGIERIKP